MICDEPVSALDVSVQAQVINLLQDIQADTGISYVFIAQDLSVVKHFADEVAVMYLGRIMEFGTRDEVFDAPRHPYTQSLLSSVPSPDPHADRSGRIGSREISRTRRTRRAAACSGPAAPVFPLLPEEKKTMCVEQVPTGAAACHHLPEAAAFAASTPPEERKIHADS